MHDLGQGYGMSFTTRLLNWYDRHGRHDLPWQRDITAYRVWLSEIMLQQTQVRTVIPYFERFIEDFPTVEALAAASQDEVLHRWTGLGYYARARNLHRAARVVADDHGGQFPDDLETLQSLPGIGRSTAGAILAIAFDKSAAILDGNVKRVLSRYHAIEGWPGTSAVQKQLWQLAESHTPQKRCADYTQAIMDLGATLCTRGKPDCTACPLQTDCRARLCDEVDRYPARKPAKPLPVRTCYFLILLDADNRVLLQQRPPTGLWGSLWCFPQCKDKDTIIDACQRLGVAENAGSKAKQKFEARCHFEPQARHTFSHYHLDYTPVFIKAAGARYNRAIAERNLTWVCAKAPGKLGMPRPVQRLLQTIASGTMPSVDPA